MATPQPIDLSGGFVPLPAPQSAAAPAAATPAKAHGGIDLSGGFVPLSNPAKPAGIDPTSLMDNGLPSQTPGGEGDSQPNALDRMYEVSGLKGIVESAKQKAQEDEDVRTEAMKHVKAGDWGSAAETILGHLAKRAGQGAMGPAGDLIKSSAVNAYAHGKPAVESGIQTVKDIAHGDLPSAELHAADTASEAGQAIPIVGPVAKQIESPAEEDIKNKNWSGLAGDVVGAVPAVLGTAKMASGAEAPPVEEPIPGAPLTRGEAAGPGLQQGLEKLLSKTSVAQDRVGQVMEDRTAAMQKAAEKVSPDATTPEKTGAAVQDAARDVLSRQQQAKELVGNMATRAEDEAAQAKQTALESGGREAQAKADEEIRQAKDQTTVAGKQAQQDSASQLDTRRNAEIASGKQAASDISGVDEMSVPQTDREIISALRGSNDAAKGEESAAHTALTKAATDKGITVATEPLKDVANQVMKLEGPAKDLVMSSLPPNVFRTLEKVAIGDPGSNPLDEYSKALTGHPYEEVKALAQSDSPPHGTDYKAALETVHREAAKDGIQPAATGVPYDIMKTSRTAVGEALQSARKHFQQSGMGSNAVRVLTDLYGSMSDAMKTSLSGDPDLGAQFEKANSLTKSRNATFVDPKFIRSLVYKDDPAKVIGSVMRSGGDGDVAALKTALEADKSGAGMARAQRGAMDYILRKSTKAATSDLPASVNPSRIDYDLALRNAESSPALKTLLGDEKYQKFVDQLDRRRITQRTPEEMALDDQLEKIAGAESPEKAAKISGKTVEPSDQATRISKADTPEKAAKIAGVNPDEAPAVRQAQWRVSGAKAAADRLNNPTKAEGGIQKVAESASNELEPSKLVDRAASSPEYTDKLLQVLDTHPKALELRAQLGQRIFRNASDNAMVRGAFGSSDGVLDVEKFQTEFEKARPSLEKILPADNLKAMGDFNQSLNKYAMSKGLGGGAGMMGRFLMMRQLFGALGIVKGLATASPMTAAAGASILWGPKLWMELATRPELARSASQALKLAVGTTAVEGSQSAKTPPASLWAGREAKQLTLQGPDGEKQKWVLKDGKPSKVN